MPCSLPPGRLISAGSRFVAVHVLQMPELVCNSVRAFVEGEAACTAGDSCSSDDGVCTLPSRRATRKTQHFAHSAMTAARSTLHGAALASIGMGEEQKLRCASIFVSPMTLSIAGVGEDGTLVAAMAQRRTTVGGRAIERQTPLPCLPTVSEESASDDDFNPDQGRQLKPGKGGRPGRQHVEAGWDQRRKTQHKANGNVLEYHNGSRECSAPEHHIDRASAREHQAAMKPISSMSAQDMANGAVSACVSREAAQLSTIQVVPEAVYTRQASLSVSQLDLVCCPPDRIHDFHGPHSITRKVNGNGIGQHHCATYGDAGHAKHVCTNYATSAELSSSPYDM